MKRRTFVAAATTLAIGAGAMYWPERWRYIVIHHTAGSFATLEFLREVHRDRQPGDPTDAIPYHYVIGNGNGIPMGQVEAGWRTDIHLWGTHVSERNTARNFFGLGVCLVGNFEQSDVPAEQFDSLVTLSRQLMNRYGIPLANVVGHGKIDGELTKCPGARFPFDKLRNALSS